MTDSLSNGVTPIVFKVEVSDQDSARTQTASAIIVIIELELPVLDVEYPLRYINERINLNELLQIMVNITDNPDNLMFSSMMIYEYNSFAPIIYKYNKFRLTIWDQLSKLNFDEEVALKLSVYDPRYFMPSQTVLNIQLNKPPFGGTMSISPTGGVAMQTKFTITFSGFSDTDAPITYQIMVYLSGNLYYEDVINSQDSNQNVLANFVSDTTFEVYLPSGAGENNELLILGRVSDSLGGIQNVTQIVTVTPNSQLLETLSLTSSDRSYDFSLAIELSQASCSDSANQTLNKKKLYDKMNAQKEQMPSKYETQQTIKSMKLLSEDGDIWEIVSSGTELVDGASDLSSYMDEQKTQFENLATQQFDEATMGDVSVERGIATIQANLQSFGGILSGYIAQTEAFSSSTEQDNYNKQIMDVTENLTNYTTINQLPNSKPFVISTDNLLLVGQTVTLGQYSSLVNPFSSYLDQTTSNDTEDEDSDSNNTDIYKIAVAQYKINPYAADTKFPYQSQVVIVNSPHLQVISNYTVISDSYRILEIDSNNLLASQKPIPFQYNGTTVVGDSTSQNLVCISRKNTGNWSEGDCTTTQVAADDGSISIQCKCKSLSPQTVVNDILGLFTNNKLAKDTFSSAGLNALSDMNVLQYTIFYELASFTLIYVQFLLMFRYGNKLLGRDSGQKVNKDQEQQINCAKSQIYPIDTKQQVQDPDKSQLIEQSKPPSENQSQEKQGKITLVKEELFEVKTITNQPENQLIQPIVIPQQQPNSLDNSPEKETNNKSQEQNESDKHQPQDLQVIGIDNQQQITQLENQHSSSSRQDLIQKPEGTEQQNQKQTPIQSNGNEQGLTTISTIATIKLDNIYEKQTRQSTLVKVDEETIQQKSHEIVLAEQDQINRENNKMQDEDQNELKYINKQLQLTKMEQQQYPQEKNFQKNEQDIPKFKLSWRIFGIAIQKNHEVLEAILNNENKELSKSIRLTIIYLKIIGLIALTSIFSQSLSTVQAVAASVVVAIFLGIPTAVLKILFSKGRRLRKVGVVLSIAIAIICWYMILTVAKLLGQSTSNTWAAQFTYSYFIDQIVSQPLGIVLKVLILKILGENKSTFARLIKKTYLGGLIKSMGTLLQKKF